MDAEKGPFPDHAPDATGKHQRTGGITDGAVGIGIAEITGALAVVFLAVLHIWQTADEAGFTDGDIELVLADQAAKCQRSFDIAAGGIDDDRQLSAAKRFQRAFEVPASIEPSADIHSGQVGSQPGALLRTTTNRIVGPKSGADFSGVDFFASAAKAAWPMASNDTRQISPSDHHA
ncbi:hypothetical protein [Mesorhizobium sp. M0159]|uniref:hypothetical protein n=1 Tax=unclassified Mesorhizobium TaxID=325217 RepID=UPI0033386162